MVNSNLDSNVYSIPGEIWRMEHGDQTIISAYQKWFNKETVEGEEYVKKMKSLVHMEEAANSKKLTAYFSENVKIAINFENQTFRVVSYK